jgi:AcrR family transcriptional regulator
MVQPQQDRSQESTRRLLDAAAELVAEGGAGRATLAAIGARAGYSRGLVSARFGSKENLLWALVQRSTDEWFHELRAPAPAGSGLERLLALIELIAVHSEREPQALRVLERLIFEASGDPALRERFVASQRLMERDVARLLRRGIGDGSIRPGVDPSVEAALLVAALRGIAYQWFLYPEEVEIVDLHRALAARLAERIGVESAPGGRA